MSLTVSTKSPINVDTQKYVSDQVLPTSNAQTNSRALRYDDASLWQSLGNILTGNLDYARSIESAMRAERVSAREAEKTRRWQEQMSNTAYSRAVADLKRNGINPYAIGYFSPASTPAGATGSAYNTSPHSAASSALNALGLVERAYSNAKKRKNDPEQILFRL